MLLPPRTRNFSTSFLSLLSSPFLLSYPIHLFFPSVSFLHVLPPPYHTLVQPLPIPTATPLTPAYPFYPRPIPYPYPYPYPNLPYPNLSFPSPFYPIPPSHTQPLANPAPLHVILISCHCLRFAVFFVFFSPGNSSQFVISS